MPAGAALAPCWPMAPVLASQPMNATLWRVVAAAAVLGMLGGMLCGAGCSGGSVGAEPIARCYPNEGACPPTMFVAGVGAEGGEASAGAGVFAKVCSECHGERGEGRGITSGIDFSSAVWQARFDDAAIAAIVRNGRPPRMPPANIDEAHLRDVIAFVRSLKKAPTATGRPSGTGY